MESKGSSEWVSPDLHFKMRRNIYRYSYWRRAPRAFRLPAMSERQHEISVIVQHDTVSRYVLLLQYDIVPSGLGGACHSSEY